MNEKTVYPVAGLQSRFDSPWSDMLGGSVMFVAAVIMVGVDETGGARVNETKRASPVQVMINEEQ